MIRGNLFVSNLTIHRTLTDVVLLSHIKMITSHIATIVHTVVVFSLTVYTNHSQGLGPSSQTDGDSITGCTQTRRSQERFLDMLFLLDEMLIFSCYYLFGNYFVPLKYQSRTLSLAFLVLSTLEAMFHFLYLQRLNWLHKLKSCCRVKYRNFTIN